MGFNAICIEIRDILPEIGNLKTDYVDEYVAVSGKSFMRQN
jgi:hypothetical protein